jgi:hypothetical protein
MIPAMILPQTTRRLMVVIAGVAALMALVRSFRPAGGHPYYYAGRAASCRRMERCARQQAAAARLAAEEAHRKAGATAGAARERFGSQAERYEEKAAYWTRVADQCSRDAVDALKWSRTTGYIRSELPEHIRRELRPEDLRP